MISELYHIAVRRASAGTMAAVQQLAAGGVNSVLMSNVKKICHALAVHESRSAPPSFPSSLTLLAHVPGTRAFCGVTLYVTDTVLILESGGRKVNSMRNSVGFDVCSSITFKLYHPTHYKHITRILHIQSHSNCQIEQW